MEIKELKDKILIAELDPDKEYICLVNPAFVRKPVMLGETITKKRKQTIPIVYVEDVNKAIKFIEIPKKKK